MGIIIGYVWRTEHAPPDNRVDLFCVSLQLLGIDAHTVLAISQPAVRLRIDLVTHLLHRAIAKRHVTTVGVALPKRV